MSKNSLSSAYEFKLNLSQISNLTNLLAGQNSQGKVELLSHISHEAILLAYKYLLGDEITINNSCASDLKILGRELKCTGLVKMVDDFEKRTTKHDFHDMMKNMEDQVSTHQSGLFILNVLHSHIISKIQTIPDLFPERSSDVLNDPHLIDFADFNDNDKIHPDDLEIVREDLGVLYSLIADVKQVENKSESMLQFQGTQKDSVMSSLSELLTFDEVNDFLQEKAEFGDPWCQVNLGKRLDSVNPELSMEYLLTAACEGRVLNLTNLAKMYISGAEIAQDFDRALSCLHGFTGGEEKELFAELERFRNFSNSGEIGYIKKADFGRVIACLETLVIPSCVVSFATACFKDCVRLKEVRFEEGTAIAHFKRCWFSGSSIQIIHVPDSVEEFEDECFRDCVSLNRLIVSSGSCLRRIGDMAFAGCSSLHEFEIPSKVVLSSMWWKDSSLSHIRFASGSSVNRIESDHFAGCATLESIDIASSVEVLCRQCFSECVSLSSVTFSQGSSLKTIEDMVFNECSSLKVFEIPGSVKSLSTTWWTGSYISRVAFGSAYVFNSVRDDDFVGFETLNELEIPSDVGILLSNWSKGGVITRLAFGKESVIKIGDDAFSHCETLEEIEIPASVEILSDIWWSGSSISRLTFASGSRMKSIDASAFSCPEKCENLDTIVLPASIEEIGDGCFRNLPISGVQFAPDSRLKRIGRYAFSGCKNFEEIDIPESVEEIGAMCFENSSPMRITFSGGQCLSRVGNDVLCGCESVQQIVFAACIKEIGDNWFSGCRVRAISFAEGCSMRRLGSRAFCDCKDLRVVDIPVSIEEIGDRCFKGCSSLSSVTFMRGSRLKSIGVGAFSYCENLGGIAIPNGVEYIGGSVFSECNLSKIWLPESRLFATHASHFIYSNRSLISYFQQVTHCMIPAEISEIVDDAFNGSLVRSVRFASGSCLKRIGRRAFCLCKCLESIEIPEQVSEISEECFCECHRLECVMFAGESRLTMIEKKVFFNCKHLTEMVLPGYIMEIGDDSFQGSAISNIGFSYHLRRIGKGAFMDCKHLEGIEIPINVEVIDSCCFKGSSLSDIMFASESTVKMIGMQAFYNCTRLERIEIPESVEMIGDECFGVDNNTKSILCSVVFPGQSCLSSIGKETFHRCQSLKNIMIPAGIEVISKGCFRESGISRLEFASFSALKRIDNFAFYGCKSLKTIKLPAGLEKVGVDAFYRCPISNAECPGTILSYSGPLMMFNDATQLPLSIRNISSVTIPSSIEVIESGCFINCPSLSSITFASGSCLMHIMNESFRGCSKLKSIEIPERVQDIGAYCFYECHSLSRVTFSGTNLKSFGAWAFGECISLREFDIPVSVEEIGQCIFCGCSISKITCSGKNKGFKLSPRCMVNNDGNRLIFVAPLGKNVTIPAYIEDIDSGCFAMHTMLHKVVFENGSCLKCIGQKAFLKCKNLQEIKIPASVEYIGDHSFALAGLSSITIAPGSVLKRIGKWAFAMQNFNAITIPASVERIDSNCFHGCSSLVTVTFEGKSVLKYIGIRAFYNCSHIENIEIPASVEELDDECFYCCGISAPTCNITFEKGSALRRLGDNVFSHCILNSISIPTSVEDTCSWSEMDDIYDCLD